MLTGEDGREQRAVWIHWREECHSLHDTSASLRSLSQLTSHNSDVHVGGESMRQFENKFKRNVDDYVNKYNVVLSSETSQ